MNPGGSNPYDTAGNMTSWNGANGYSYGPFNETWRVVTSNQEWVHVYTADDERLFSYEVGGGQLRRWALRGLDNRVLREYTFVQDAPSGVIERDNIYRGSGPLLAAATPAGDRHYHVDHLGTPRQITDATGAQVAFHTYYPYGEEATSPTQDTVRFKFTGHERDLADPTDTQDDLDHMHARMTNPRLGRFLSVDPAMESARAGSPQTWNRYAYVAGNPLKYTDPTGEAILALVWPVAEVALTGMDVWETAKTIGDADRSGAEKIVKVGLTLLGAVTIGGGATKVDGIVKAGIRGGERLAEAVRDLTLGVKTINPSKVRFSQSSISSTFKGGEAVEDLAKSLSSGAVNARDVPAIRLVEREGQLFTLDNRRLEAFRRAGVEVPYRMATPEEAAAEAWKFTTGNGGVSVRVRGE